MSIRKVNLAPNEYYHLYNRGNTKQKIFFDSKDYYHFVELLYLCNTKRKLAMKDIAVNHYDFDRGETLVHIGAFCLMPNHFHILVKEREDGGISKFMQKLSTAYVMYLNTRYKRTGSLFEGKFKSEHLYNDRYLKYIFSYIHLNPLKLIDKNWKKNGFKNKSETEKYLANYLFSSFSEYIGRERLQSKIISREFFPDYFTKPKDFMNEIGDWIRYNDLTPEVLPRG